MTTSRVSSLQLLRRAALSAAMLLVAAPLALADTPGYEFMDFESAAGSAKVTPFDAQIAAVDEKADQALAAALQALRTAARGDMPAPRLDEAVATDPMSALK